jgi:hypothetical protein
LHLNFLLISKLIQGKLANQKILFVEKLSFKKYPELFEEIINLACFQFIWLPQEFDQIFVFFVCEILP